MDLNLNTILEGVILAGVLGTVSQLSAIKDHLAKLNGRVGKTELALEMQTKVQDERHATCVTGHRDLWEAVRK